MTTDSTVDPAEGRAWVLAVYILYLVGFGLVGVILAYVKRYDLRDTIWESHLNFAIRTFWLAAVGIIAGIVLTLVLIGILVLWAVGLWALVRVVYGLVQVASDKPIPNPQTWFI
ncbi:MAG TPA: hypothetical protein VGM26_17115 [Rhizomicrobium sp.]|jgi:uncharacterized membrane protein